MLVQARHCVRLALDFGELTITAEVEARLEELGFTPETLIDAIGEHKSDCSGNPSIYCGTYGKYSGEKGICGLWIDLTTFNDYDDFLNFCNAIHADEDDPELMAQDYEGFPRQWYNEGFMSEDDFDNILDYSDMCDKHGEAVDDYMEFHDELDHFEEAYYGEWDSEEYFARHIVRSATTSKGRWATLNATSITKPSDATCSCKTTRWAQTATCSALSDPFLPLSPSGLFRKERLFVIV